ncbi:MAG: hypothetical protein V4580_14170 [Bacteroidota bacterium]
MRKLIVLLKRLDVLFLLTGILLFIMCFFMGDTFDVSLHDTYFVIAYFHIGLMFLLIHGMFALTYFVMRKHQTYFLGILHLLLGTPLFIYIILISLFLSGGSARRYYTTDVANDLFDSAGMDGIYLVTALFVIAQLLFLIHIVVTTCKTLTQQKETRYPKG